MDCGPWTLDRKLGAKKAVTIINKVAVHLATMTGCLHIKTTAFFIAQTKPKQIKPWQVQVNVDQPTQTSSEGQL